MSSICRFISFNKKEYFLILATGFWAKAIRAAGAAAAGTAAGQLRTADPPAPD